MPLALLYFVGGVDLPYILKYNLANAALAEARRPYFVWLFYGPLEFVQLLGLPLAAASVISLVLRPAPARHGDAQAGVPWYRRLNPYTALFWLVVLGLDVAGRSKAEQGRLFLFLMPIGLMGVYFWASRRLPGRGFLTALFVAQMLVCLVIGARWYTPG
jgi:hypothetical protein